MKTSEAILKTSAGDARCKQGCPAGIDIPRFIRSVGAGKLSEALAVFQEKNPFPAITGRVCPAFCQDKCRRAEADSPVTTNALERFISEQSSDSGTERAVAARPTGKNVAIVGSGPAGLAAAFYLAKQGHSVTVFEQLPKPGGMLRVGIPDYRLPEDVLDTEIKAIENLGAKIETNTRIESIDRLFEQGYNAIFVALGAHLSTKLTVDGEDSPGVIEGVTFLKDVSSGKKPSLGDKVAVLGGGNVAIDSARTALRLSSKKVTIIYRRSQAEMLASAEEVEQAVSEGIETIFLAAPTRISRKNGNLVLHCIRMELGEPDSSGRRRPIPIRDSDLTMDFDSIVTAIGQVPDVPSQFGLTTGTENRLQVDSDTLSTRKQGVFAGGDVVIGTASVIEAIAAGRKAAISIDKYLGGTGELEKTAAPKEPEVTWSGYDEDILDMASSPMPLLPVDKRTNNFAEVKLGFSPEIALEQTERCLRCDLQIPVNIDESKCVKCYACQLICSLVYQRACNPEKARIKVGSPNGTGITIGFTDDCISGCSLCIQHCLAHAISI